MGTSYDTVDVLDLCLVVATSYNSNQAEQGEAVCLAVLANARLGGRATLGAGS